MKGSGSRERGVAPRGILRVEGQEVEVGEGARGSSVKGCIRLRVQGLGLRFHRFRM